MFFGGKKSSIENLTIKAKAAIHDHLLAKYMHTGARPSPQSLWCPEQGCSDGLMRFSGGEGV
jgi:hypothetical protein